MNDVNDPKTPRRMLAKERQKEAVKARLGGLTYDDIVLRLERLNLGKVTRAAVIKMVEKGLAQTNDEVSASADELRKVELRRLDTAQAAIWGDVLKGDVQAIDRLLKIQQRRAAYLGLDAPTKADIQQKIETVEAYDYAAAIAPVLFPDSQKAYGQTEKEKGED